MARFVPDQEKRAVVLPAMMSELREFDTPEIDIVSKEYHKGVPLRRLISVCRARRMSLIQAMSLSAPVKLSQIETTVPVAPEVPPVQVSPAVNPMPEGRLTAILEVPPVVTVAVTPLPENVTVSPATKVPVSLV